MVRARHRPQAQQRIPTPFFLPFMEQEATDERILGGPEFVYRAAR